MKKSHFMKAAVLHAIGDLRVEEVEVPSIGPKEVLIKVKAAGVCGSDIPRIMVTGTYHFPTIPGHEFAGEVAEVGNKVTTLEIQDRITVIPCIPCRKCKYCQIGEFFHCENYNYLGSRTDGGFAEYVKAPWQNIVKLPQAVDFEEGACVEPVSVALHAINRAGGIKPGDYVAVFGAGPIGNFCAQWAKALGAERVFVVDIIQEKVDVAKALGITDCINAKKENAVKVILEKSNARGVDLAIEAAGTNITLEQSLLVARPKGKIVFIGRAERDIQITDKVMSSILRKELNIFGVWGFEFIQFPHHSWQTSLCSIAKGKIKIKPLITHRFSLDKAPEVLKMMYNREEYFNKVMFLPWGENE